MRFMRWINSCILILCFLISFLEFQGLYSQQSRICKKLVVSKENPHYLSYSDGTPFFWLADTGWELFWRVNRDDAAWYLTQRKIQGFNVIQAVILSELEGAMQPNVYGDSIFYNRNPEAPAVTPGNNPKNSVEYDFWDHIDYCIAMADSIGLYMCLLPTWGEYVVPREDHLLFKTPVQAYNYGWFLGNRYRDFNNIIWMLGGDRLPDERREGVEIWRAMAEGIADGTNNVKVFDGKADYSTTLMTHHCFETSSRWFHNDAWIDFHSWGSYHSDYSITRSYKTALADWNLPNPKPTLNSEPAYELHIVNWINGNGMFGAYDVRVIAYWSVFAGAMGHTYGCHPVWQFYDGTKPAITSANMHWKQAVMSEGARQIKFLRSLIESRPLYEFIPDNSIILGSNPDDANHVQAIRGKNFVLVYLPTGYCPHIKLGVLDSNRVKVSWFNPRNGEYTLIGDYENTRNLTFVVPGMSKELDWLKTGRGCDWVLVIEEIK